MLYTCIIMTLMFTRTEPAVLVPGSVFQFLYIEACMRFHGVWIQIN